MIIVKDKASGSQLMDRINGPGNVIVLYYADWCGHCVRFKPEWNQFKKRLMASKEHKGCEVAEVEQSHLSHVPVANVQGFPTIKFYRPVDAPATGLAKVPGFNFLAKLMGQAQAQQGGNNEIPFEQERNIPNLLKFVRDNRYIPGPETKNTAVKLSELKSGPVKKHTQRKATKRTGSKPKTQKRKIGKIVVAKKSPKIPPKILNSPEYKASAKKYKKERSMNKSVIADTIKSVFG